MWVISVVLLKSIEDNLSLLLSCAEKYRLGDKMETAIDIYI